MPGPPQPQVALAQRYGRQYGVDPRLLLAIGGHETHWGALGAGRQGYTLGYGATDSGTISKYAGIQNQYRYAAQTLAKWGAKSIADVLAGKASSYATDPGWERGVANVFKSLGGLAPSNFGGAMPAPQPPEAGAPIGGSPGVTQGPDVRRLLAGQLASGKPIDWLGLARSAAVQRQSAPTRTLASAAAPPSSRGGFVDPATGKIIGLPNSGTHTLGNWESDRAIDVALPEGTPIRAPFSGVIGSRFGSLGKGGRFAGLRLHIEGAGDEWYGAHLSRFAPGIRPGQKVKAGQIIGYSGSANGVAHLHEALRSGDPRSLAR